MAAKKQEVSLQSYDLLVRPLISEKTTYASANNQYCFEVAKNATKPAIKKAIEEIFDVKVKAVNTLNQEGKAKRFKGTMGKRKNWKKAIIRLEDGHSIDVSVKI